MTIAEKEGVPLFESWARVARGWALAHLGQAEQGVAQIREGLAMASAISGELWRTYNLSQLAEACGKAGRLDEALEVIAEALALVREKGERWWEAETFRLGGELLLKRSPSALAEAQTSFEQAIEIACAQNREITRAAGDDEPRAIARIAGSSRRGAHDARGDLQLVYRGLRHCRSKRCKSTFRSARLGMLTQLADSPARYARQPRSTSAISKTRKRYSTS